MKGFAFKLLPPKDIVGVLNMIGGIHPAVTGEHIDRPLPENAFAFFSALSEFAYDMDAQQVKAAMPGVIAHPEIYDEAMDVLTVFKLSRQLAMINLVDDFNFKDFWEPGSKRFRAILSGFINFCRYKEAKVIVITEMKEDVQALDGQRLELVDQMHKVDGELGAAQERHNAELHDMWTAEKRQQRRKRPSRSSQRHAMLPTGWWRVPRRTCMRPRSSAPSPNSELSSCVRWSHRSKGRSPRAPRAWRRRSRSFTMGFASRRLGWKRRLVSEGRERSAIKSWAGWLRTLTTTGRS